jgi:hypothetical protein
MSGRDHPWESAAAAVLKTVLRADAVDRRDRSGGPPGQYDLDVRIKHQLLAVEVTRSTTPRARAYGSAVQKTPWPTSDLAHTWVLSPVGHPMLEPLRRRGIPLLKQLEDQGVTRIEQSLGGFPTETRGTGEVGAAGTAATELLGLGVDEARCVGPGPGKVFVNWPVETALESPDSVTAAVEAEAPANAGKLGAAAAYERHLFVWIEIDNWPAWVGLRSDRAADARIPSLPPTIDAVWAAALVNSSGLRLVLWKATRGEPWSSIFVDETTTRRVTEELGF